MPPADKLSAPTTCGRGGIGRRAALRSLWGNPWKFESSRPHHFLLGQGAENFFIGVEKLSASKVLFTQLKFVPESMEITIPSLD